MDVSQLLDGGEELQWFDIIGSQPLARIQIKLLRPREFDTIINQSKRFGGRRAEIEIDDHGMIELLDKIVVDWSDIKDGEDEFSCNRDNKIKLDENWMLFRKTWRDIMMDHLEGHIMKNKAEVGN